MKPSGEIVDERGDAHRIEAGQETEANEIAERVGQRQDFGVYHLWNGRWPGSEFAPRRYSHGEIAGGMDIYNW